MSDEPGDEMELWGTVRGWSIRLGVSEEVLRGRFAGLPVQKCLADDPARPGHLVVTDTYPRTRVLAALTDLTTGRTAEQDRSRFDSM